MPLWMLHETVNYNDGHHDDDTYGPWSLEEIQAYLKVATSNIEFSSLEIILVPKPDLPDLVDHQ